MSSKRGPSAQGIELAVTQSVVRQGRLVAKSTGGVVEDLAAIGLFPPEDTLAEILDRMAVSTPEQPNPVVRVHRTNTPKQPPPGLTLAKGRSKNSSKFFYADPERGAQFSEECRSDVEIRQLIRSQSPQYLVRPPWRRPPSSPEIQPAGEPDPPPA